MSAKINHTSIVFWHIKSTDVLCTYCLFKLSNALLTATLHFRKKRFRKRTWSGSFFTCLDSAAVHFKLFLVFVPHHIISQTPALSLSLIHSFALSAAMRVDAAHTDSSQHSDSPLLIQTHAGTSAHKTHN